MYNLHTYMRLCDGEIQEYNVKARTERIYNVDAVFIKGFSQKNLNSEFGAGIEFSIDDAESFMADYRHCEFWCRPEFAKKACDVPDETQGLIYRKKDGTFGVILPVVSEKYKCVLKGTAENKLCARLFSLYDGLNYCDALAFVYAEGENPYELLKNCAAAGMKLLNHGCRVREERRYPEVFEYLGWCSWDAMEIRVNEDDLIRKCDEFKEKDIPVKWAIIDDMWGEVHDFYDAEYKDRPEMFRLMHSSKLYSFKADPIRFPNGLKHCIDKMNGYGIKVGMWHPTTGYWMGIDPEGDIYHDLKDCLIKTVDGRYVHSCENGKAYKYYSAFHDYLRECGAEFIKIDNQSMSRRFFSGMMPVGEAARGFHNAMEASVGQHFDNSMINCMGMANEDMWNRTVSPISRCSDDFLPEDRAWFTKHILQCSYNDLIQGQFYYCDWDMWWTDDGQALKNSVLRAVSGGPVYVSDKLERSRKDVLMPLILNSGRILRCDRPAMPSADCLTENPVESGRAFKLQNICGKSGVIAAFNLDKNNNQVLGKISPSDIDGIDGDEFAVYEHFTRELKIVKKDEEFEIALSDNDDFRLYIIVPMHDGFAAIGRTDKFISPKTIAYVHGDEVILKEDGEYAVVKGGELHIY